MTFEGRPEGGRDQSRGIREEPGAVARTLAGGLDGSKQQKDLASLRVSWGHTESFGEEKHDLTEVHEEWAKCNREHE